MEILDLYEHVKEGGYLKQASHESSWFDLPFVIVCIYKCVPRRDKKNHLSCSCVKFYGSYVVCDVTARADLAEATLFTTDGGVF